MPKTAKTNKFERFDSPNNKRKYSPTKTPKSVKAYH